MTRNILLYILVIIFLFACATPQKYDAELNRLVGQNVSVLEKNWGRPALRQMLDNGGEIVTYIKTDDVFVPSETYLYNQSFQGNPFDVYQPFINEYDFSAPDDGQWNQVKYVCRTSFLVQDGIIAGWKWKGNGCLAD